MTLNHNNQLKQMSDTRKKAEALAEQLTATVSELEASGGDYHAGYRDACVFAARGIRKAFLEPEPEPKTPKERAEEFCGGPVELVKKDAKMHPGDVLVTNRAQAVREDKSGKEAGYFSSPVFRPLSKDRKEPEDQRREAMLAAHCQYPVQSRIKYPGNTWVQHDTPNGYDSINWFNSYEFRPAPGWAEEKARRIAEAKEAWESECDVDLREWHFAGTAWTRTLAGTVWTWKFCVNAPEKDGVFYDIHPADLPKWEAWKAERDKRGQREATAAVVDGLFDEPERPARIPVVEDQKLILATDRMRPSDYVRLNSPDSQLLRRACVLTLVPAESAIRGAMMAVESMGACPRLTDAIVCLETAKEKVADYVDSMLAACDGKEDEPCG